MTDNSINEWLSYIMVPREELLGFPICPYAKQAIKNKTYTVLSANVQGIEDSFKQVDLVANQVVIIKIDDYLEYTVDQLSKLVQDLNQKYKDLDWVILENDPRDPFTLNGITTTYKDGYLLLIQSRSDLNSKHKELTKTNYYTLWSQKQLDEVVNWRLK